MQSSLASTEGDTQSRYGPSYSIFERPACHTIPRGKTQLTKVSGVIAQLPKKRRKGSQISTWIDETRMDGCYQIPGRSNTVARYDGAAATGRFVDHHCKWLVFRRQDHKIRRGISGRQLRLVQESHETDTLPDPESCGFPLQLLTLRSFTDINQKSIGETCLGKTSE